MLCSNFARKPEVGGGGKGREQEIVNGQREAMKSSMERRCWQRGGRAKKEPTVWMVSCRLLAKGKGASGVKSIRLGEAGPGLREGEAEVLAVSGHSPQAWHPLPPTPTATTMTLHGSDAECNSFLGTIMLGLGRA